MNGTAIADLSWAEKQWAQLYEGQNEVFVTGMVAFIMHEVVYFGRYIPWFICDFIPAFQKYKLQPVSDHHLPDDTGGG
jgi:methylsterol monooxygenase